MGQEIRTRRIEKNIKVIDKGAVAADHLKKTYVRTKNSVGQMRQESQKQEQEYTESCYAEDKLKLAAGMAVRQSVRSAGEMASFSSAGLKDKRRRSEEAESEKNKKQAKQEMLRQVQRRWKAENEERIRGFPKRPIHSAGSTAGGEGNTGSFRMRDGKAVSRQGNYIKTSNQQSVHKPAGIMTAQDVAKKTYVRSKISKDLSEKTLLDTSLNTEITAKMAEYKIKAGMKTGASAARAVIASTKSLFTAIAAGGSVTAFLLIFVILFGGILYTVGGGNSSAVSPVSKEVERYEPLIRKYANQYGIGEYVELIKAVMMQESGGRGLDPMQSSEGAFNKRYPRQPNGIKDPEYSIDCGVQELKAALVKAEVKSPIDMEHIKLALQGYNFGSGYISWAVRKDGGYTTSNAAEFSDMMARRMGWSRYGDKEYVPHVLRYYTFGRIPTGIGNQSIVQVALSQEGNQGGRPYWSWYGYSSRVSWCACFVSWCADKCGYIENGMIPKFSSCANGASWFKGKGRFKDRSYVPSPGDIIFFDWGAGVHHVGIVVNVENGRVNTIEGNSSNAVRRRSYKIGDRRIHGYGVYAF